MPVETRSMKRSRAPPAALVPPSKSPPSQTTPPKTPTKKARGYLTAQQMQAAFLHVTKPVVPLTATSPPPPAPRPPPPPPAITTATSQTQVSTVTATPTPSPPTTPPPKPEPAPKSPSPKIKPSEDPEEDPAPVPTLPPPSVSPEAAAILSKIDAVYFTQRFLQLNYFKASVLSPSSPAYSTISEYITNSQAHGFQIDLISILKISRPPPTPFIPASSVDSATSSAADAPPPKPFTMMLWHGTRPQCVAGILYNGFKCPSIGNQMFGQGVYFADRISKSAQYTHPSLYCAIPNKGDVGYLFLCEVVLGKIYNAKNSNSAYKVAPTATRWDGSTMTFDSVMCTGAQVPDRQKQREIDGVTWPLGPTVANQKFPSYTVNYNEYIVYKPREMVDIKYLVEVKFS